MQKSIHIILSLFFISINTKSFSQSVAADFSFNNSGTVVTSFGAAVDKGWCVATQTDGKIIVAGTMIVGLDYSLAVVRYNVDGSLDTSFATAGKFIVPVPDIAVSICIQPDNKILLGGSYDVIRLNSDGSYDTSFGIAGKTSFSFWVTTISLLPDGKIMVGGMGYDYPYLQRLNADGSLDGTYLFATLIFGSVESAEICNVQVRPDGKLMVMSSYFTLFSGEISQFYLLERHHTNGSFDTTFNSTGVTNVGYGGQVILYADGRMLVGSQSYFGPTSTWSYGMFRIDSSGNADTSFIGGSVLSTAYGGPILLQPDGKIILCGHTSDGTSLNFTMTRYNSNGTYDSTFGPTGAPVVTDFGDQDIVTAAALQSDGKIILIGCTDTYGTNDFAVARYHANAIGIDESINENAFNVYPNPVSNQLTISSKTTFKNASLKLINISGQIVFTQQNINGNNFTIDVSSQPTGLYLVEITENESVSRMKLVKE